MKALAVRTRSRTAEWVEEIPKRRGPNVIYITAVKTERTLTFQELLEELLENTYITHAGLLLILLVGIPQGFSCGVYLAVWTLFGFELEWVINMVDAKKFDVILRHCLTMRLNDDILTIDQPEFPGAEIYPEYLVIKPEQTSYKYVHFLDLGIRVVYHQGGLFKGFRTEIYDKRQDKDIGSVPMIKYPAFDSALAYRVKANTIRNMGLRAFRLCSTKDGFVFNLGWVLCDLLNRGYTFRFIIRHFWQAFEINGDIISRWFPKLKKNRKNQLRRLVMQAGFRRAKSLAVLRHLTPRFAKREIAAEKEDHAKFSRKKLDQVTTSMHLSTNYTLGRESHASGMLPSTADSFVFGSVLGAYQFDPDAGIFVLLAQ